MRRLLTMLACTAMLAGCETSQLSSAAQINEKADTEASLLYAAIATILNGHESLATTTPAQKAHDEAIKLKAWNDLMIERQAYAAGGTVILTALQADQTSAKAATAP
jgi:uncharacterized lipoprotein YajG